MKKEYQLMVGNLYSYTHNTQADLNAIAELVAVLSDREILSKVTLQSREVEEGFLGLPWEPCQIDLRVTCKEIVLCRDGHYRTFTRSMFFIDGELMSASDATATVQQVLGEDYAAYLNSLDTFAAKY